MSAFRRDNILFVDSDIVWAGSRTSNRAIRLSKHHSTKSYLQCFKCIKYAIDLFWKESILVRYHSQKIDFVVLEEKNEISQNNSRKHTISMEESWIFRRFALSSFVYRVLFSRSFSSTYNKRKTVYFTKILWMIDEIDFETSVSVIDCRWIQKNKQSLMTKRDWKENRFLNFVLSEKSGAERRE